MAIELTNFTVWGKQWFADGWHGLEAFCARHGIAGIELLGSGATPQTAPPAHLIRGIHLRGLGGWLPLAGEDVESFGEGARRYREAKSYPELVALRAEELRHAAVFAPDYVVWHGNYATAADVLGGPTELTAAGFLHHLASLARDVLDEFSPPFTVCFENAFGMGLDPAQPNLVARFVEELAGLPVGIALDVGHHLNRHREMASPEAACEELLRVARGLKEHGLEVEVLHLHWTPPELVPEDAWEQARLAIREGAGVADHATAAGAFFEQCDQHRPLAHPMLSQAVMALGPKYVVHELGAMSLADHSAWLAEQAAALRGAT